MESMREMGSAEMMTSMMPVLGIKNPFAEKLEKSGYRSAEMMLCCLPFF